MQVSVIHFHKIRPKLLSASVHMKPTSPAESKSHPCCLPCLFTSISHFLQGVNQTLISCHTWAQTTYLTDF